MAAAVLDEAVRLGADPGIGLVERVVAWQAAHRVRADLQERQRLVGLQCQLIHGLEELGDPADAYEVAKTALTEYPASPALSQAARESDELSAALLRLAWAMKEHQDDPLVETTVASAMAGGAAVGLEARVWAAIDLLDQPDKSVTALNLVDEISGELGARDDLGPEGDRWRLLLAFQVGRAGYPAISQQLLTPMLNPESPDQWDAAQAVLSSVAGPQADARLAIVVLEAELLASPEDADDDRLRLHAALRSTYASLGEYRQALDHAQHELPLRRRIQGADHPDTLTTRNKIAVYNGRCGDAAGALRLLAELLPDQLRVLGPDHRDTLTTRNDIAYWTGECGDVLDALRLFRELLHDQTLVLGPLDPDTLTTRINVAHNTGNCGDVLDALRLFRELLPHLRRILGPDNRDTLIARSNIAYFTSLGGNMAGGLRLFTKLLHDQVRVLGPDHPDTLRTRSNIAACTGRLGDAAGALRLFGELLPDQVRALGPDHPDTLRTRDSVEFWKRAPRPKSRPGTSVSAKRRKVKRPKRQRKR
jgi:tetratricopeptide (TPR) repeat protein